MEELAPKIIEYGALAVINVLLIFKGVKAIQELTSTIDKLAVSVEKIADRQSNLETEVRLLTRRVEKWEYQLEKLFSDLHGAIGRKIFNEKDQDN